MQHPLPQLNWDPIATTKLMMIAMALQTASMPIASAQLAYVLQPVKFAAQTPHG